MRRLGIAVLATALAACGGGGGGSPTSSATTTPSAAVSGGTAEGQITGFGSVIVDGVRYDDAQAKVIVDDDADAPRAGTTASLRLGMQVALKHGADDSATEITVDSSIKGPVTSVDVAQATIVVLGTTVKVVTTGANATLFDGYGSLTDVKAGDIIEVHAVESTDAGVQATRIERASAGDLASIKLVGRVSALDAAGKRFKLGAMTINYAAAKLTPANAVLANDQRVVIYSKTAPAAATILADQVKVKDRRSAQAGKLTVGGVVTDFQSSSSFNVSGFKVDASSAKFEHGTTAGLANGARIKVKGITNGDVLKADEVEFKSGEAASTKTQLTGPVVDFIDASAFRLRGQLVDASLAKFDNGSQADLRNGAVIKVEGQITQGKLVAKEVKLLTPGRNRGPSADRAVVWLDGTVYGVTAASFKLSDIVVAVGADTQPADFRSRLVDGARIKVRVRRLADGSLFADAIEFKTADTQAETELRGLITDFVSKAQFRVAGQRVNASAAVFEDGLETNLRDGQAVEVEGSVVDGVLKAKKVQFESED